MHLLIALLSLAAADIPPPNMMGCADHKEGDACTTDDGRSATCVKRTCGRLDYSQGTPPKSASYDCMLCESPAAPAPTAAPVPPVAPAAEPKAAEPTSKCGVEAGAPSATGLLLLAVGLAARRRR